MPTFSYLFLLCLFLGVGLLSVAERGLVLWLVERRRGLSLVVLLGKMSAAWLKNTMKMLVCKLEVTEFIKSSKRGEQGLHCP